MFLYENPLNLKQILHFTKNSSSRKTTLTYGLLIWYYLMPAKNAAQTTKTPETKISFVGFSLSKRIFLGHAVRPLKIDISFRCQTKIKKKGGRGKLRVEN